jgi:hypothetical protein
MNAIYARVSTVTAYILAKLEYKTMRWSAEYLVPENNLLNVIGNGLYEPWELVGHFTITEEFATFRMRLFGANNI